MLQYPYRFSDINQSEFKDDDTLSFNQLIDKLFKFENYGQNKSLVEKGLKICKVFRNKEGHVVVYWHEFDSQNYRDIETSLIIIYEHSFGEKLDLTFSFAAGEKAKFKISKIV